MKKAGYLLLLVMILFLSACGKKSGKIKHLQHSPIQNPDGIYFEDDPEFVKYYSAYLKKMARSQKDSVLDDPLYSIDSIDSIRGAEVIDSSSSGWNVDTIDSNPKNIEDKTKRSSVSVKKSGIKSGAFATKDAPIKRRNQVVQQVGVTRGADHKLKTSRPGFKLKSGDNKSTLSNKKNFFAIEDKALRVDKTSVCNTSCAKGRQSFWKNKDCKKSCSPPKAPYSKLESQKSGSAMYQKDMTGKFGLKHHKASGHLKKENILQKGSQVTQKVSHGTHVIKTDPYKKEMQGIKEPAHFQKSDKVGSISESERGCSIEHYLTAKANKNLYIKPNAEYKDIVLPKLKKY